MSEQHYAINRLPPADYALIDTEHVRIHRLVTDIRDTCCNLDNDLDCRGCGSEKLASCRGRLPSFLLDTVDLSGKHFYHEEAIMLRRPNIDEENPYYRLHNQAHGHFMQRLNDVVRTCATMDISNRTSEAYRHFYTTLLEMVEEHDRMYDHPFIQSTQA